MGYDLFLVHMAEMLANPENAKLVAGYLVKEAARVEAERLGADEHKLRAEFFALLAHRRDMVERGALYQ